MRFFFLRGRTSLLAIVLCALILRVGTVVITGDRSLEYEFDILVHNMRTGNGYSWFCVDEDGTVGHKVVSATQQPLPSAYVPPVYPLFLVSVFLLIGTSTFSIILIEIIQAFLGALACLLLYEIALSLLNRTVALVAAFVYAVYPTLVFMCGQISAVNFYVFLNILLLFILFKAKESTKWLAFAAAGVVFSLLVLARTDVLILLPAVLIWLLITLRTHRIRTMSAFTAASLLLVIVWTYRNYRVFGQPAPISTSTGYNLWIGQNEHATGTRGEYTIPPFTETDEMWERIHALTQDRSYEIKRNDLYLQEALSFMKHNPGKVLVLGLKKLMYYWGHYWGITFTYPQANSPAYWLPWFFILPFFVIGLAISFRNWKQYLLLYFYFLFSTLTIMVFFVIPRYRLFILPLVLLFAAHGIVQCVDWFERLRAPRN
jgi:4-amino-4-deoxy-L-arabinose transferase-like glycosyltransferase